MGPTRGADGCACDVGILCKRCQSPARYVCIRSNGMTCPTHGTDHWKPLPREERTMNPSHKTETTTEHFEWNGRDSKWEPVHRTVEVKTHSE